MEKLQDNIPAHSYTQANTEGLMKKGESRVMGTTLQRCQLLAGGCQDLGGLIKWCIRQSKHTLAMKPGTHPQCKMLQRQCRGGLERIRIGVWKNSWEAVDTVFGSSDEHLNEDSCQGAGGDRGETDLQAGRTSGRGGGEEDDSGENT